MHVPKIRNTVRSGPEQKIVDDLTTLLMGKGWYVIKVPGTALMAGFPDLYATHRDYRVRLIEVKDPNRTGEVFTPAQLEVFPLLVANGSPIWVLTAATMYEYEKLFKPLNWYQFLSIAK